MKRGNAVEIKDALNQAYLTGDPNTVNLWIYATGEGFIYVLVVYPNFNNYYNALGYALAFSNSSAAAQAVVQTGAGAPRAGKGAKIWEH